MSWSGSDTDSLSNLYGNQANTNFYDPDRAYMQKLMAYEMYGNQGVTGSEYNPFNQGPATDKSDPNDWLEKPPTWAHGAGWTPESPLTPIDRLPPPYSGGDGGQVWNGDHWEDPPPPGGGDNGPGGDGGEGANPFVGNARRQDPNGNIINHPTVPLLPRRTRVPQQRPLADFQPQRFVGDPGSLENPIDNNPRGPSPFVGDEPRPPAPTAEEERLRRIAEAQNRQDTTSGRPA